MQIHSEEDILRVVREDGWMMGVLQDARSLQLPDWWVCAGFVRSKIWDVQHGFAARTTLADVDVIYYDPGVISEETEKRWEAHLRSLDPSVPWSVKNQARMHTVNTVSPYTSSTDGMSKFPETATALGLSLDEANRVVLAAPHGIRDAVELRLRATPHFAADTRLHSIYEERLMKKNWPQTWPKLQVFPAAAHVQTSN